MPYRSWNFELKICPCDTLASVSSSILKVCLKSYPEAEPIIDITNRVITRAAVCRFSAANSILIWAATIDYAGTEKLKNATTCLITRAEGGVSTVTWLRAGRRWRWWWWRWRWRRRRRRWWRWRRWRRHFCRIRGVGVDCTNTIRFTSVSSYIKITFHSPLRAPWILHYPIIFIIFWTITDYQNSMINVVRITRAVTVIDSLIMSQQSNKQHFLTTIWSSMKEKRCLHQYIAGNLAQNHPYQHWWVVAQ